MNFERVSDILCSPGRGLLSVSTGGQDSEKFLKRWFRSDNFGVWKPLALKAAAQSGPLLIGVPSDSGGGIRRGAAHGPLALRECLFKIDSSWKDRDLGDVPCIPQLVHDSMYSSSQLEASGRALWGDAWAVGLPVSPLNILETLCDSLPPENPILIFGGDHSVSGPLFSAWDKTGRLEGLAVLHIDAHTDLLEERWGVTHCFGTWTSHAVRRFDRPESWVQVGIRASGKPKQHWESKFGLKQYWADEVRKSDPKKFAQNLLKHWKSLGCSRLYVTVDIDGLDASQVPSTGTPEPKGLKCAWVCTVLKILTQSLPLAGADVMEVAPDIGSDRDRKKTLDAATQILKSLSWS
jgi:agmatinase